ncbi:MAG: hypothetical protein M1822_005740 [Bathelium mastoideum]|nr:MAG: hypothetical protein M1822_005740 [Bathelium mastoideum]
MRTLRTNAEMRELGFYNLDGSPYGWSSTQTPTYQVPGALPSYYPSAAERHGLVHQSEWWKAVASSQNSVHKTSFTPINRNGFGNQPSIPSKVRASYGNQQSSMMAGRSTMQQNSQASYMPGQSDSTSQFGRFPVHNGSSTSGTFNTGSHQYFTSGGTQVGTPTYGSASQGPTYHMPQEPLRSNTGSRRINGTSQVLSSFHTENQNGDDAADASEDDSEESIDIEAIVKKYSRGGAAVLPRLKLPNSSCVTQPPARKSNTGDPSKRSTANAPSTGDPTKHSTANAPKAKKDKTTTLTLSPPAAANTGAVRRTYPTPEGIIPGNDTMLPSWMGLLEFDRNLNAYPRIQYPVLDSSGNVIRGNSGTPLRYIEGLDGRPVLPNSISKADLLNGRNVYYWMASHPLLRQRDLFDRVRDYTPGESTKQGRVNALANVRNRWRAKFGGLDFIPKTINSNKQTFSRWDLQRLDSLTDEQISRGIIWPIVSGQPHLMFDPWSRTTFNIPEREPSRRVGLLKLRLDYLKRKASSEGHRNWEHAKTDEIINNNRFIVARANREKRRLLLTQGVQDVTQNAGSAASRSSSTNQEHGNETSPTTQESNSDHGEKRVESQKSSPNPSQQVPQEGDIYVGTPVGMKRLREEEPEESDHPPKRLALTKPSGGFFSSFGPHLATEPLRLRGLSDSYAPVRESLVLEVPEDDKVNTKDEPSPKEDADFTGEFHAMNSDAVKDELVSKDPSIAQGDSSMADSSDVVHDSNATNDSEKTGNSEVMDVSGAMGEPDQIDDADNMDVCDAENDSKAEDESDAKDGPETKDGSNLEPSTHV